MPQVLLRYRVSELQKTTCRGCIYVTFLFIHYHRDATQPVRASSILIKASTSVGVAYSSVYLRDQVSARYHRFCGDKYECTLQGRPTAVFLELMPRTLAQDGASFATPKHLHLHV